MSRYRLKLAALALLMLSAAVTPAAASAQDAPPDPAQQAAEAADTMRLSACASAAPADGDQATAATRAGIPITIKDSGKTQTLPFSLGGGAYTVRWQVAQSSDYATYSVRLMPVVDAPLNHGQSIWSAVYTKNPDSAGETHLYDVKPGRYYLAVDVPKGWSVTFTPLAV